ncbi:hypothetical protein NKH18_47200 [Streptomyces sp. M10(2022)]
MVRENVADRSSEGGRIKSSRSRIAKGMAPEGRGLQGPWNRSGA